MAETKTELTPFQKAELLVAAKYYKKMTPAQIVEGQAVKNFCDKTGVASDEVIRANYHHYKKSLQRDMFVELYGNKQ